MAERKSLLLRLDPRVHRALARWAADDLRSVNGQIEFLLRRSLRQAGRLRGDDDGAGAVREDAGDAGDAEPPEERPSP